MQIVAGGCDLQVFVSEVDLRERRRFRVASSREPSAKAFCVASAPMRSFALDGSADPGAQGQRREVYFDEPVDLVPKFTPGLSRTTLDDRKWLAYAVECARPSSGSAEQSSADPGGGYQSRAKRACSTKHTA